MSGIILGSGITLGAGIALGQGGVPTSGGYIDIFGNNFTNPSTTIGRQNNLVYDSSNNLYMVGYTDSGSNATGIVAKYNVSGAIQWQRTLGASSPNSTNFFGIDLDNSNNLYISGYTSSDGTTDGSDVQIVKYDTNGNLQWQKTLGSAGLYQTGLSVVVEQSTGDFYVGGSFLPTTSFPQYFRGLLLKYDSSGTLQWQRSLTPATSTNQASCQDIALDSSGNIYIAGSTPTSTSSGQGMLIKYNSSGTLQWQVGLSKATGQSEYDGITIDSSDNIFVTGYALTGVGGTQYGIVAKYNTSGALQWKKQIGDPATPIQYDITVDSSGNIYTTGSTYILKYNTSGDLLWQRQLSATSHTVSLHSITIDSSDNIVSGGYIRPTGGSNNQILMLRVPGDGTPTGTYTASGISFTYSIPTMPQADLSAWSTATTTLSAGTPTFTAATSSLTGATSTFTNTVTPIPGGTPGINNVIGYTEMPPPVTAGIGLEDPTATVNSPTGFTINDDTKTGIAMNALTASNEAFFATYGTGTKTVTWGAGSTVASSTVNVVTNNPSGFPQLVIDIQGQTGPATYNYPFTFS